MRNRLTQQENSPIKRHGQVYQAFKETTQYLTELLEHKKKQMAAGEHDKVTMDLMGDYYFPEIPLLYLTNNNKEICSKHPPKHLFPIKLLRTLMPLLPNQKSKPTPSYSSSPATKQQLHPSISHSSILPSPSLLNFSCSRTST